MTLIHKLIYKISYTKGCTRLWVTSQHSNEISWEKLSQSQLVKSDYYLKLADQGLIEPLGLCRNIETTIMVISV